ncbi:OprD family porin [Pseudomonas sp. WAC2]|uniref:OprD family porin n=1 Tax=Pseudomonas sp. WAC2 TaxID=3055057 RepID=UPI0025B1E5C0|nr:OprD family porin [Pseudomonas sp. WAC2]MDN3236059.1 OprD family porin [Pseudomonas sp. WAC2]
MGKKPLALAVASACLSLYAFSSAQAAGFVEDSKATLSMRNFYINTDNRNGSAKPSKNEEWGQGFMLNYQSGYTQGTVGFGVDAVGMLGLRLDGGGRVGKSTAERQPSTSGSFPLDTDGSYENEFSSLGLTAKVKVSETELRYGTLSPKLPVVTINDGRLLPQTFQGGQIQSKEIKDLTFTAGQLSKTKTRGSSSSDNLSIAGANSATGENTNKFWYAGADYQLTKDLTLQYYYGNLEDFYKQHFLGLGHSIKLGEGTFKTDLRYFNSKDDGANNNTSSYYTSGYYGGNTLKGKVDNQLYSALFAYTIQGHTVAAGYQISNGNSDFPFINTGGGATAYINTDAQIAKFNRAGEDTWQVRYSYDFAAVGMPGLTAGVVYLRGDNIDTGRGDRSEWERDFTVTYVIPQGTFKGLGLSWKNASFRTGLPASAQNASGVPGARDQDENRLIVSYSLPLL